MASEIQFDAGPGLTGITAYAMLRNATGQVYNTAGSAFENYNAANITDYDIALTEQGAIGYFVGDAPAVADGLYPVTIKQRAGGSPAVSDTRIGGGNIRIGPESVNVSSLTAGVITATSIADGALTAAKFASGAFDAVWSVSARTLTSISGLGIALATKLTKYVQLLARKDSAIATDNATELTEINANGGSGAGGYANSADALEAVRDRGDAAWVTATGFSTLTQAQVTGGAYALNSASFSFNAALDFTTAQKAATLARVTLVDTLTTYTSNTPQTGDSFARIGLAGAGLTAIPWNPSWDAEVQSEVIDALNQALTESYRSAGSTASAAQMLYEIIAHLGDSAIVSTTKTLKKLDGTTAKTYTLDSATTPTSITETT